MTARLNLLAGWCLLSSISLCQIASAPKPPGPNEAPPPASRGPALDTSLAMAQLALRVCKVKGYDLSVSVVDSAGGTKVTLAGDGPHGIAGTSVKKAATAVHFGMSGDEMEKKAESDKAFAAEAAANPAWNIHSGSLLLKVNGEVIGAIAVTGAPHDVGAACLQTAYDQFKSQLR